LSAEITDLDARLTVLVKQARPDLLEINGVGVETAAQLLSTCGDNPDRLYSEAAFASLCGVSPVPASSGKTKRHRLNRGGDRQANRALYVIALSRMAHDTRTRDYVHHPLPQAIHRPRALQGFDPPENPNETSKRSCCRRLTTIGASHRLVSGVDLRGGHCGPA
jgi:hypothetical protein